MSLRGATLISWSKYTYVIVLTLASLFLGACSSPAEPATNSATADTSLSTQSQRPARSYQASWIVEATWVESGSSRSYVFTEAVDDETGRYMFRTADHLGLQSSDEVVFCAGIARESPYCATAQRAHGVPNVLSYPLQRLSEQRPNQLFDLASYRTLELTARQDPDNWTYETRVVNGSSVDCFIVSGDSPAARPGFTACFTNDERRLIALLDVQGDAATEILLVEDKAIDFESFVTGLEEFYEARPLLQERLLEIYPELPVERDPVAKDE